MSHLQRRIRLFAALPLAMLVAVACAAPAEQTAGAGGTGAQETISVSGAFALFPLMSLWAEEYQKINPNVQFDVQAGGAGKGMTDMLSGAADIAMLSARHARRSWTRVPSWCRSRSIRC